MKRMAKFLKAPIFVWWDITKNCNFKCKHCYSDSGRKSLNELSFQEVINIVDQLIDMEVFYIYFLGGEPLMRKDIFDILSYCSENGMVTMMSTNGWFVNPATAKQLKATGIHHVRVSLDGATSEVHDSIRGVSGSFDRALKALEFLGEAEIPTVGISPTLLPDNLHQIGEIIDLVVQKKVNEIQIVQLCATGRGQYIATLSSKQLKHAQREVEKRVSKYNSINISATEGILDKQCRFCMERKEAIPSIIGCVGGRSCAAIDAEGCVFPCIFHRKQAGNLKLQSFQDIWNHSPLFLEMREIKDACIECIFSDVCVRECSLERKISEEDRAKFVSSFKISPAQPLGCYEMGSMDCFLKI